MYQFSTSFYTGFRRKYNNKFNKIKKTMLFSHFKQTNPLQGGAIVDTARKKVPLPAPAGKGTLSKRGGYLLSRLAGSTIGAGGLNFSVRDGKRWDTAAIATIIRLT